MRKGFLSVVAYDPKQDKEAKSPFKKIAKNKFTHVLVRARVKKDLEVLRPVVPNVKVVDDVIADYKYRAVISRRQFKKFLSLAVDDIDYDSHFKEVMRAGDPDQPGARYSAVSSVWHAMIQLQPVGAWASSGSKGVTTLGFGSAKSKYHDSSLDDWWAKQEAKGDEEASDEPVTEDTSTLSIYDVKSFILSATDEYPNYLLDSEVARTTEAGFELWARVMEDRKKLGKANLHVDDEYLEGLITEIEAKQDALPLSERSEEFVPPEEEEAKEKLT